MAAERTIAVVQARAGSSRLPRKVLLPLVGERTVLGYVVERVRRARSLDGIVVATTRAPADDAVAALAVSLGADVFRGSEDDVLARFVGAVESARADVVVRICADSPLLDPATVDQIVAHARAAGADYACATGYPLGTGVGEYVRAAALREALAATSPTDAWYREHVTTYVVDHPERFAIVRAEAPPALARPSLRLTLDEPADFEVARAVAASFAPRIDFDIAEILAFLDAHPEVATWNAHVRQRTRA